MLRAGLLFLMITSIILVLLSGCSSGPESGNSSSNNSSVLRPATSRGLTGTFSLGNTVDAASASISPSGGNIKVNQADSLINGLELSIPSGAYSDKRDFKISCAPIEKHSFGEDFNPITPLITVENGGEYSAEDLQITIPVNIPQDKFAMGFLYDSKTKILEGMPLMAESTTSITVATRHFSSFVISVIDKFKLKKDIDTSFRPGIDDWQFTNYGSFIVPKGHCAGQSVSAMWYYYTQPDGANLTLFGRYDNNGKSPATPGLWWDDSWGYRLASMVQYDMDWDTWASKFFTEQRGINDELTWEAFAYSMQFLGQPQYVSMAGGDKSHAIICYRIKDGNLYVADPNFPGNTERRIEYSQEKFAPYSSGDNKAAIENGQNVSYTKIGYVAQSSRVDWTKMTRRWNELKKGTIGNDQFPAYKIMTKDEKGQLQEIPDGYFSTKRYIYLDVKADFIGKIFVFRDGKTISREGNEYRLDAGNNLLGIYIAGKVNDADQYVDYKYLNVIYGGLNLKPARQEGTPDQNLTFNLELTEPAPVDSKFEWYVDGALKKTGYDFSIQVAFPDEGQHTIAARVVDAAGKVLLQAQGIAIIKARATPTFSGDNLSALQAMKYMRVAVKGKWSIKQWLASGETTKDSLFSYNIPWYPRPDDPDLEITWSGTSFAGKKDTGRNKGEVKGAVSADGKVLISLEWINQDYNDNGTPDSPWKTETTTIIKLQNVPIPQLVFEKATEDHFTTGKIGADVKNYVTEITYSSVTYRNGKKESESASVPNSIQWNATDFSGAPALNVSFEVERAYYPGG